MRTLYLPSLKILFLISLILILATGTKEKLSAASVIWIGSFSSQWNNFKNWNCHCIPSNGDDISIQPMPLNPPIITAASAGTFIPRNLTIQNVATLTMTGGTLVLTGHWTNDGSFDSSPGTTVIFAGDTLQKIQGTFPTTFYNLTIASVSSMNQVALGANIFVNNTLSLINGGLDLNGNILSINNPSVNAISRTSPAYIKSEKNTSPYGELKRTINNNTGAYLYPFGKSEASTDYIPFIFNIQVAGSDSGTVSVSTYSTGPANDPYPAGVTELKSGSADNSANVIDRFWIIDVAGYAENPRAAITFTYSESEIPANGEDLLQAQRWNGSGWDEPGTCVPGGCDHDNATNTVTAYGISSFSPWTLSRSASPLPVTFLNFEARSEGEHVNLFWTTATEINNDYFTIERSENARQFESIARIKGTGNTASAINYEYRDISPGKGKNREGLFYYRIRQTDFDGKYSYSNIIFIRISNKNSAISIYPNPSDGKRIFLGADFFDSRQCEIRVFEISGREVFSIIAPYEKFRFQALDLENKLVKGNYLVTVKSGNNTYRQKLVVQ